MPVEIRNVVKIVDIEGKEHTGIAVIDQLLAVKVDGEEGHRFGRMGSVVKILTKVICDSPYCDLGKMNERFQFEPKIIEFEDIGSFECLPEEAKEVANYVPISGEKLVFCCTECLTKYLSKQHRLDGKNVIPFPTVKKSEPARLLVPDRS